MPLNLPEPSPAPLARSPLALVVCQVRYAAPAVSAGQVANFATDQRQRGHSYPKSDQIRNLTINVNPLGPVESASSATGWRLQTEDGTWIVSIGSEAVALETTRYGSWADDFRTRLSAILEGVVAIIAPEAEIRLGLRFVDVISRPNVAAPAEWRGRIADWLLGPLLHEQVGAVISNAQQQLTLDLGDGVRVLLRHGAYPDAARNGSYTYLLDTDVYREQLRPFDAPDILAAADAFHTTALALFQAMITRAFYEELGSPA